MNVYWTRDEFGHLRPRRYMARPLQVLCGLLGHRAHIAAEGWNPYEERWEPKRNVTVVVCARCHVDLAHWRGRRPIHGDPHRWDEMR